MQNNIGVTIYDSNGALLLQDRLNSPFLGLQTGETFWYGSEDERQYCKVSKIVYGIDNIEKCCKVEIIVEKSDETVTKTLKPHAKTINHGIRRITGGKGGSWNINNDSIICTVGVISAAQGYGGVCAKTIQLIVTSEFGSPIMAGKNEVIPGQGVRISTEKRDVICTLVSADYGGISYSEIHVIETIFS